MEKNNLSIINEELTTIFGEDGIELLFIYQKLYKSQNHKYLDSLIVDLYDIYSQLSNESKNYSIDKFVTDIENILKNQNKNIEEICITDIIELRKAEGKTSFSAEQKINLEL